MAHIKKLVITGFKSFARRTEIVFDQGINVIIGPNGSGKSNVSDALCFVLGRLSIKSMRAAKSKNLLFMGSKYIKPAREASVELVFDNSDRAFSIDRDEITIKRAVRHNGQGIYKINEEVKTRIEIIEMLAQAGIDPHGFNLVLQGQIQAIVKMHPEERRKIIEEVAGIAIYESRKEKSLHELEKTDERLKEIGAILRERTAYMKNLEKERAQALRFKELETTVKRAKATIIQKNIEEKEKEINSVIKSMEFEGKRKDKLKEEIDELNIEIEKTNEKINDINKHIQQTSGVEQEALHTQIANLKAEIEGLRVRRENHENRKIDVERRISEILKSLPEIEREIHDLREKSPMVAKKAQELKKKKDELSGLEEGRNKLISLKSELNSIRDRIKDKEKQVVRAGTESDAILKRIEEYSSELTYNSEVECSKAIEEFTASLNQGRKEIEKLGKEEVEKEKALSVYDFEIKRHEKTKKEVEKIDICPLCQSKITAEHIDHVFKDANSKIKEANDGFVSAKKELELIFERKFKLNDEIKEVEVKLSSAGIELIRHRTMKDLKKNMQSLIEQENALKQEVKELEEKRKNLEVKIADLSSIEEQYDSKMLEIEEISSRTEEDVDTTLLYKQREIENAQNIIKRSKKDLEDIDIEIKNISESLQLKEESLEKREEQEKIMNEKFKKMFEDRDLMQKSIHDKNMKLSEIQNRFREIEEQINMMKVDKARLDANKEALNFEMNDFAGVELIQASRAVIEERLTRAQQGLSEIGSINLRALEVYDEIKKEYDAVQDKVNVLQKEKEDIMKIIEEIDKKKLREFMKTFRAINEKFMHNFGKLYTKGQAYLEIENKEDVFAGGVNIVVRLAKGKYFDVTSLSGGEQTLVAMSLLFAIQEYKPYHFYIFDEIDAALDKRNSERLAALLNQYMRSGQYIIITHNDAIILNSNYLYGVSMHDGVSKILSLKLDKTPIAEQEHAQEEEKVIEEVKNAEINGDLGDSEEAQEELEEIEEENSED